MKSCNGEYLKWIGCGWFSRSIRKYCPKRNKCLRYQIKKFPKYPFYAEMKNIGSGSCTVFLEMNKKI